MRIRTKRVALPIRGYEFNPRVIPREDFAMQLALFGQRLGSVLAQAHAMSETMSGQSRDAAGDGGRQETGAQRCLGRV